MHRAELKRTTSHACQHRWLLDDTYGEDFHHFYQYCLSSLFMIARETMRLQCQVGTFSSTDMTNLL